MESHLKQEKETGSLARMGQRLLVAIKEAGYGLPFYRKRLQGRHPLKLSSTPVDPFPGDRDRGDSILLGRYLFAGDIIVSEGEAPWELSEEKCAAFQRWLHSFVWLRDLDALPDSSEAQKCAQALTASWMERYETWHSLAWQPDIIGARLTFFGFYSSLALSSSDLVYRSLLLTVMSQQARHLARTVSQAEPGLQQIKALVGLIVADTIIPEKILKQDRSLRRLERTLQTWILADGGARSRNPSDALSTGECLMMLKIALRAADRDVPVWLRTSLDKLLPFLRAMRHGDAGLVQVNGAFAKTGVSTLKTLNELSGAKGKALHNMPFSGYQRLEFEQTIVVIDAGPPPVSTLSRAAHEGELAFEFSDGQDRVIVNLGGSLPDSASKALNQSQRMRFAAAHSVLTLEQGGEAPFSETGEIGWTARSVRVERQENDEALWLNATTNRFRKNLAITYRRRLYLSRNGTNLRGEDSLSPIKGQPKGILHHKNDCLYVIRFHLHPLVKASQTQDGEAIILRLVGGHGWLFRARGASPSIEDSQYVDRPGFDQRTRMIVLRGAMNNNEALIKWSFRRMDSRA